MVSKSEVIDPAVADAAFKLASGDVSQPVQGKFGVALVKVGKIEPGVTVSYESVAQNLKQQIATERARQAVGDLRDKMEDERAGGASVTEAAQKLKLAVTTIDAVDRSGRQPDGQPVPNIPRGLSVVSQAFNSDVGVDNDPISYNGGYVWYDVLGITPSRDRTLDEVKDQVEAKWHQDQIDDRLKAKGAEIVKKLEAGGKLADEAAALGVPVETAANFKREDTPPGLPATVVSAAFRTAKDGAGQTAGGVGQWIVFRVTDITVPPTDFASDDVKKLKDSLERGMEDEQIAEYVAKLETNIGTSINEGALAQAIGDNNNNN
jgi:peptidyl-prolyl cis-trans isomerase D